MLHLRKSLPVSFSESDKFVYVLLAFIVTVKSHISQKMSQNQKKDLDFRLILCGGLQKKTLSTNLQPAAFLQKKVSRLSCKRVGGRDKQWRQVVLLGSPVARLSRASRGNEATAKLLSLAPAGTPPPYHTLPYQSIPDQVGDLEQPIIQVAADASCALTRPSVTSLCLNLVSAFPLWKLNMSVHCILYN